MTIHSTGRSTDDINYTDCAYLPQYGAGRISNCLPDFYNYFQHGIEFLISGSTHIVQKIILHTNVVSQFDPYIFLFSLISLL
jgi:hypothetical protein